MNGNLNIKKLTNTFRNDVYLSHNIVLKYNEDIERGRNEVYYLKYFQDKINEPKVIDSGIVNNRYYLVMNYIEGNSYTDEDFKITIDDCRKIGKLLASIHIEKNNDDSWITYTIDRINMAKRNLLKKETRIDVVSISNYLTDYIKCLKYIPTIIHNDFRIANLIFNKEVYLIDLENMMIGDCIFDFVKMYRLFDEKQFSYLIDGYQENKSLPCNFYQKLKFYNLYESFTTMGWLIGENRFNDEFYQSNLKYLYEEMNYLDI